MNWRNIESLRHDRFLKAEYAKKPSLRSDTVMTSTGMREFVFIERGSHDDSVTYVTLLARDRFGYAFILVPPIIIISDGYQ